MKPPPFLSFQSVLLTLGVTAVIILLAMLPANRAFITHVRSNASEINDEAGNMSISYRLLDRYGKNYAVAKRIQADIKKSGFKGKPLILVQPNTYFRAQNMDITLPEPAIFYNYTGLQSIWKNSNMVKVATHIVEITPPAVLKLTRVDHDTAAISAFLARYTAYDIAL